MYRFFVTNNKVICVSSYKGKPVRGVAKCAPNDTFDEEYGRKLAQARCDFKVARKRFERANDRFLEADAKLDEAHRHFQKMDAYLTDSGNAFEDATDYLAEVLAERE